MFPHNIPRTSALTQHLLFVLVSSFQRTVSSHFLPKHHVPRIPAFISLHFRATFLHPRPSPHHQTQPTITETSLSPFPTKPPKKSRKYHSLLTPLRQHKPQKYPTHHSPPKKPRKYAYFRDFFGPPSCRTFDGRSVHKESNFVCRMPIKARTGAT